MNVCMHMRILPVCMGTTFMPCSHRTDEGMESLELESQRLVSCPVDTEKQTFVRAASAFN